MSGPGLAIPERAFQATVLELAVRFGWRAYHTWSSRRSPPGFPDLVLVRPPRLIACELKRETGRVSVAQQAWLDDLRAVPGLEVYVWRPSDREAVVQALR